jgi:hypothetical protein
MITPKRYDEKLMSQFADYLRAQGISLLNSSDKNAYEVLRFQAMDKVSIIYKNKYGELTYTGDSLDAMLAFCSGKRFVPKPPALNGKQRKTKREQLVERDGTRCFYCGGEMCFEVGLPASASIEHLIGRARGGTEDLSNLVLAHAKCNGDIGDMDLVEKIKARDKMITVRSESSGTIIIETARSLPPEGCDEEPPWVEVDSLIHDRNSNH